MNLRIVIVTFVALWVVAGCSSDDARDDARTEDSGSTSASCADVVFINGEQWTSWALSSPLARATQGPDVRAQRISCDDALAPGESFSAEPDPNSPVMLRRIKGIPAEQALVDPENPTHVYVHATPDVNDPAFLPDPVAHLIANG